MKISRFLLSLATLGAIQLALSTAGPSIASATVSGPRITVTDQNSHTAETRPGGVISISGSGFGADDLIDIWLDGRGNEIGQAQADDSGAFEIDSVPIPPQAVSGLHTIGAQGVYSLLGAAARLQIATSWQSLIGNSDQN